MPTIAIPPSGTNIILRATPAGVDIEIQDPKGFSLRALDPVMHIGTAVILNYGPSQSVGDYGIVFKLTADEFNALPDGASINISYGAASRMYGTLNKATVLH